MGCDAVGLRRCGVDEQPVVPQDAAVAEGWVWDTNVHALVESLGWLVDYEPDDWDAIDSLRALVGRRATAAVRDPAIALDAASVSG